MFVFHVETNSLVPNYMFELTRVEKVMGEEDAFCERNDGVILLRCNTIKRVALQFRIRTDN